jgi:hypothetical protein
MQVTLNGTLTVQNFSQKVQSSLTTTPTITGSNVISDSINVPTGSWTILPTGSNIDFRIGCFTNNNLTDSIYIGLGTTGSNASILQPDDSCVLTFSGSAIIYAKAVGTTSPANLSFTLVSYN